MKNTKIARRAVTMVLVLSMLLCVLPAASAATTATITENGSTTVDLLMGDTCTLTYTPDTTGTHLFYFEHQVDEHTWDMIDFLAPGSTARTLAVLPATPWETTGARSSTWLPVRPIPSSL